MFGPFRPSRVSLGGLLWYIIVFIHKLKLIVRRKSPWKLSPTRKANQRKRLKQVDAVIEAVRQSGVQCGALVNQIFLPIYIG